jgi:hypothetical protein
MKWVTASLLSLLVMQSTLVGCSKPKQRPDVINKDIASHLVVVSDLHDVTSDTAKAYFYLDKPNESIKDSTAQIKIDENSQKVLSLVVNNENKAALDEQLKSGLISFVLLEDQVKIYKVLRKDQLITEKKSNLALTLADLKLIKNPLASEAAQVKNDIQFIEISSIKIDKTGVLENQKTQYYEEKMSVLNVVERQFDLSTHLILSAEVTTVQK